MSSSHFVRAVIVVLFDDFKEDEVMHALDVYRWRPATLKPEEPTWQFACLLHVSPEKSFGRLAFPELEALCLETDQEPNYVKVVRDIYFDDSVLSSRQALSEVKTLPVKPLSLLLNRPVGIASAFAKTPIIRTRSNMR